MVNFTLSAAQHDVRTHAANQAKNVLTGAYESYQNLSDQATRFRAPKPFYEKLVRAGLLIALIPKGCGGSSDSFLDLALIVEELYAVNSSVNMQLMGTALGLLPIIIGGTEEQKKQWLKPFLTGEGDNLASFALSEPGGTANFLERGGKGLGVTGRKEGDYYVVNGEKVGAVS
jgi:alkylation response protein AidB-like acyl-CoA dehydrogenase